MINKCIHISVLFICLIVSYTAQAQTILYVDDDANGANDGTSWDDAYIYLQDALANSSAGDLVLIARGVYYPDQGSGQTEDDPNATFTLKNGVVIYGGFKGDEECLDESLNEQECLEEILNKRDWYLYHTKLSGDIDQNDVAFDPYSDSDGNGNTPSQTDHRRGDNAMFVVTGSYTDASAVLDGVHIVSGEASFETGGAGGMFNFRGDPTLRNIYFAGNRGFDGGGMFNRESNPTLINVYFYSNATEFDGGGMFNNNASPSLVNVIFYNNAAASNGGGLFNFSGSNPVLTNVTIAENVAQFNGGGIGNRESNPTLKNVIIWENKVSGTETSFPASSVSNYLSAPQFSYSLIANSGGSANWISDMGTDGGNNIDADPLFVDRCQLFTNSKYSPITSNDLGPRLQSASPAVNAGDPSTDLSIFPGGASDPKDIFEDPRVYPDQENIIDMGAAENQGVSNSPSVTITGNPGWRMMGMPATGITVSDLASVNLVQGIQGIPFDVSDANLYVWNPSASTPDYVYSAGAFEVPASGGTELHPGQGFIWYMYGPESRSDISESRNFPVQIEIPGNSECGDLSLGTLAADWHLIANPFIDDIQFDQITDGSGSLLNVTGQVWDPNAGSEGSYVLTTSGTLNNILSVWQGAFIELTSQTEVVIPQSAKTTGATFLKEQEQPPAGQVEFVLEGKAGDESILDKAAILYFSDQATEEWDGYDVPKLIPFSQSWATMNLVGSRDEETVLKSQHSLPYDFTGTTEIPVDIQMQNFSGTLTLSWPVVSNLPQVEMRLVDRQTGERYDLSHPGRIDIMMETATRQISTDSDANRLLIPGPEPMRFKQSSVSDTRFVIQINPQETPEELPTDVTLNQNYPNPFNPMTIISYELPVSSEVRLEVYDMLGRNVAMLVNGQVSAGRHTVNFEASNLSSGVYLYRLQAGVQIMTKKLTILK